VLSYDCLWRLENANATALHSVIVLFSCPKSALDSAESQSPTIGRLAGCAFRKGARHFALWFSSPPVSRPPSRVSSAPGGVEPMPRLSAATLKAAIDPEGFYRSALPDLKGKPTAQGWILAVCPFHGDTDPSLSINLKHGGFFCFGCGQKGDLISFHAKLNRLSFREAVNDLARRYLLTVEN